MRDPAGWAIMPVLGAPDLTEAALGDLLAQSVPLRVLIINQGVDTPFRAHLEQLAEQQPDRILVWHHQPALPSLSATWNRALRFVWACGGTEALVVNNDVRLHRETVRVLSLYLHDEHALFVSAVGVREGQFDPDVPTGIPLQADGGRLTSKGGPDFSCFLLSQAGHEKYPFDERFVPAYGEDCSTHREYMLNGDGHLIFSINLPYLHVGGGSGTLKSLPPAQRTALERRIGGSREYYKKKWGGYPNDEKFTIPFDPSSAQTGVTNPELQALVLAGGTVRVASGDAGDTATPDSPESR